MESADSFQINVVLQKLKVPQRLAACGSKAQFRRHRAVSALARP
jgi:hypothetical protein